MDNKKVVLTGDRPTGKLHIGHLMGSLLNRVKLQNEYKQFVLVANVQALTDNFANPEKVRESILELLCDYAAVGIDFEKTTVFIQSEVKEIHEIFVYLSNFVTIQQISHNPTIKQELAQKGFETSTPLGFFMYPVHQVGDILCVNADLVPVGKDQAPMIESSRALARKFNETYKANVLNEPKALFGVEINVPGVDGNAKMGKSLGNAIYLSDSREDLKKKIFKAFTDPERVHISDPGKIEGNVVFAYLDLFDDDKREMDDFKRRYKKGGIGDVEIKQRLFEVMDKKLSPIREKRKSFETKKADLLEMALEGSKKVSKVASEVVGQMKEAMKIKF